MLMLFLLWIHFSLEVRDTRCGQDYGEFHSLVQHTDLPLLLVTANVQMSLQLLMLQCCKILNQTKILGKAQ